MKKCLLAVGLFALLLVSAVSCSKDKETETALKPSKLHLSQTALDFGKDKTTLTFAIVNQGEQALHWVSIDDYGWLTSAPVKGSIAGGKSVQITLTIDRAKLFSRETKGKLIILYQSDLFDVVLTAIRNAEPTDIALSAATIAENTASGTQVGTLTSTDIDADDTFTYALLKTGTGSDDHASFEIKGDKLKTKAVFDFEKKARYKVRIRTTDQKGASFEKDLIVAVSNVNEAPTGLALSKATIAENTASGTLIGKLTATDADKGDAFTYTIQSGNDGGLLPS